MRNNALIANALARYEPEALAQRAGNRDINGGRQIHEPPAIILCQNLGSGEGFNTFTTTVTIPTPDSRCRVKVSIFFVPVNGPLPNLVGGAHSIWIAACDYDRRGAGGGNGQPLPVTNVEGVQGTPTGFPQSLGLAGYSREFVTAADCLQCVVTVGTTNSQQGNWVLQTRIQPDAVSLPWAEWDEIRRLFAPSISVTQGTV